MAERKSRRWWVIGAGVAALALAVPALPSRAAPAAPTVAAQASPKIASALQGIVSRGLTDQIYGPVVEGHVPGTVYYLAHLTSVDPVTLAALRSAGATIRYRYDLIGWVALSSPAASVAAV